MWESIFNWTELVEKGGDAATYFFIAIGATTLFSIRLVLMLFGADDTDTDIDIGDDALDGADEMGSGEAFNLFSLLSILAFLMGVGWMGLTARLTWDLGTTASVFVAVGSGGGMMLLAASLMFYVRRLEKITGYDVKTCVGHTGRVYLTIPAAGNGAGQIEITVTGRRKILTGRTNGDEIAAFTSVKVVEITDDNIAIVEPV